MKLWIFSALLVPWLALAGAHSPYPEDWWQFVPRDQAAGWEILPQEAGPGEVILSKRTELGVFSNFAKTPFVLDGHTYSSVEGFWQMMKYPEGPNDERLQDPSVHWPYSRDEVASLASFEAKKAGQIANENMKKLGIKWVTYKGQKINYLQNSKGDFYQLILQAETAKLEQTANLKALLKKTGTLKLLPDHKQDPQSAPAWKYFDIWMELRSNL